MEQVILYSTHCPKCVILEKKMIQKMISYETITDMDIMTEKGFMSVPMLEYNGTIMNFTQASEWINEREGF